MEIWKHVPGTKHDHTVEVFALSTCGWCKKVKKLLQEHEIEYRYVDFDKLPPEEKSTVREKVKEHNPRVSFPTIVIDDGAEVIIGYKEDRIKEVLA